MKAKFVKVWDKRRLGRIPFIVLQVEESDTFLTQANFNPGYKFIIQAWYNRVGAAGGHSFNPYYYNERARDQSQKIDTAEADVLGFYLGNIRNIHDIPENLYTEKFWDAIWTSHSSRKDKYEGDEDYYKLLLTSGLTSAAMMLEQLDVAVNCIQTEETPLSLSQNTLEWMEDLAAANDHIRKQYERMGFDIHEMEQRIRCIVIDKENLSIKDDYWSTNNNSTIANYLWLPFDEMPSNMFQAFVGTHDDYRGLQILDLSVYS